MEKRILLNQCGYRPHEKKTVTFRGVGELFFLVCRSDGTIVYQGVSGPAVYHSSSEEVESSGDFSEVTQEGVYFLSVPGNLTDENEKLKLSPANQDQPGLGESDFFCIGNDVYKEEFLKSVKFFYMQRCGYDFGNVSGEYKAYGHRACHIEDAKIYVPDASYKEEKESLSVNGGWHDAGDYGKYVVAAAMAVAQLLLAFEEDREWCGLYSNPEDTTKGKEKFPDYLREVKYELDWMLTMQREDGKLYHKVTPKSFCSFIMPQDEDAKLCLSPVSVTATADFAAALALAYGIYKEFDEEYADILKAAAIKAYDAAMSMELPGGFKNPAGIVTGEYEDDCDKDELYWASAQMYKTFGDERYYKDFKKLAEEKIYGGYGWADMGSYGNIAILSCERPVDEELLDKIREEVIRQAEDFLTLSEQDGYNAALSAKEYIWGSNLVICNRGRQLLDAYELTKRDEFREAALEQLNYLFGKNPMGICYLTGCGSQSVLRPHHRPSVFVGKAMPGMLSGGPCDWLADDIAKGLLKGKAPACCFVDMVGSYSTNEVTIYWNSALVWLLTGCFKKTGKH